jgi:Tol biopolymer transport system component
MGRADLSRHGRYAAITVGRFHSQVWVWDRVAQTLTPASVSPTNEKGNAGSRVADITPDGRLVLFSSTSTNLVSGDTNDRHDAFVRDMRTGTTQRVSLSRTGDQLNSGATAAALSANGRIVFFSTTDPLLPGDTNDHEDVYARNVNSGRLHLVSRNSHGRPANAASFNAKVSDDGEWVAFRSRATNLNPADRHSDTDAFLRNRRTGRTYLASKTPPSISRMHVGVLAGISGDGQVVAFNGFAMFPDDSGARGAFVYQRATGKVHDVLGSLRARAYGEGTLNSLHGNQMTISTDATLSPADTRRHGREDVYLYRPNSGKFKLLTPQDPPTRDHTSTEASTHILSRDGHTLLFETAAPYATTDTDDTGDAYIRDVP